MVKRNLVPVVLLTALAVSLIGQISISKPCPRRNRERTVNTCRGEPGAGAHTEEFSGWNTYSNERFGIEFRFPPRGTLDVTAEEDALSVRLDLPKEQGTLLTDKYLSLSVRKTLLGLLKEIPPAGVKADGPEFVEVSGREYERFHLSEGAAGSIYDSTIYLTKSENYYYVLEFVLRSSNPGAYGEDPPPDFNRAEESDLFAQLLSTVTIDS